MDVVIRGKNVKVSESLRTAAQEHLAKLDRYANGFARAEVDFSEERNPRIADNQKCEVLVHVKGHLLKAHASASEPFAALYAVCDKVEHQVKRLKDKRVARSHPRRIRSQLPQAGSWTIFCICSHSSAVHLDELELHFLSPRPFSYGVRNWQYLLSR